MERSVHECVCVCVCVGIQRGVCTYVEIKREGVRSGVHAYVCVSARTIVSKKKSTNEGKERDLQA